MLYFAIQPTIRDPDNQTHMITFQVGESLSTIDLSSEKEWVALRKLITSPVNILNIEKLPNVLSWKPF